MSHSNALMTDAESTGALAIFVKTPGLSSIKTRLASKLGSARTSEFYNLSVTAIRTVAQIACHSVSSKDGFGLTPYWAIAESEGMDASVWSTLPRIWQGDGGLGARLSTVYNQLLERHPFVLLIGADSPQLSTEILIQCCESFSQTGTANDENPCFVLGRADDGGYYLFGGNQPISQSIWESVPYSVSTTAEEFARHLQTLGQIQELPRLFDIDTIEDLRQLSELDASRLNLLEEQRHIIDWARRVFEAH